MLLSLSAAATGGDYVAQPFLYVINGQSFLHLIGFLGVLVLLAILASLLPGMNLH
ncbi:MAG: hypothetical protein ABSF34_08210 [Verrucomicrobiota bacterium]